MGRQRNEFHEFLKLQITPTVYFQPPSNKAMTYPCIIYNVDDVSTQYADNLPHRRDTRYLVTVVDRDPDSEIAQKISLLPLCSFSRFYTADNLNHFVYNLYF